VSPERSFEEAIEYGLLRGGPDAPGDVPLVHEALQELLSDCRTVVLLELLPLLRLPDDGEARRRGTREGDFFVRSGPGTVKLAPDSAEKYIRTRFGTGR
jgi:hypothetical protein